MQKILLGFFFLFFKKKVKIGPLRFDSSLISSVNLTVEHQTHPSNSVGATLKSRLVAGRQNTTFEQEAVNRGLMLLSKQCGGF